MFLFLLFVPLSSTSFFALCFEYFNRFSKIRLSIVKILLFGKTNSAPTTHLYSSLFPLPQPTPESRCWGRLVNLNQANKKAKSYDLEEDSITVGRHARSDVVLEDPRVSSHHCVIVRKGKGEGGGGGRKSGEK